MLVCSYIYIYIYNSKNMPKEKKKEKKRKSNIKAARFIYNSYKCYALSNLKHF